MAPLADSSDDRQARDAGPGRRVAVVGATGNIGTALVAALSEDPAVERIVGIARRTPAWQPPRTEWRAADITTDDLRTAFDGCDTVVHLAWAFQPTHDPRVTWKVNAVGSQRVFDAAAAAGVRTLVHSSSIAAYSPAVDDTPVAEHCPTDSLPTAAYGREKAYVERVLDSFELAHPDMRVVRLRPGFVFQEAAASEQWRVFAGGIIPSWLVRRRAVPVLPFDRTFRIQFVHADDVADAFRLAVHQPVRGAFNVAAEPVVTARDLARAFDAKLVHVPRRVLRAAVAVAWRVHLIPSSPQLLDLAFSLPVMSTERARTELGWSPRHDALRALASLLAGLSAQKGFRTAPLEPPESGDVVPQGRRAS